MDGVKRASEAHAARVLVDDVEAKFPDRFKPAPGREFNRDLVDRGIAIEWGNETGVECDCGSTEWVDGGIDDGGVCPGTSERPATHWFDGYLVCQCGERLEIGDSD